MEVNIHEARARLSGLIEEALAGEDIVIAKAGVPVGRLVRIESDKPKLASARGQFKLKDRWESPLSDKEIGALFSS